MSIQCSNSNDRTDLACRQLPCRVMPKLDLNYDMNSSL